MKKILLSLILILSLAILCSCNSQNNVIVDDETTVETSNNVTAESTQVETQTGIVEETTENKNPIVRENVVYVSYLPSNFSGNDARVSACPEGFSLVSYVEKEKTQIAQPISEFVFYG